MVIDSPFYFFNSQIAPIASPGFLGTVKELSSKPLYLLTPRTDGNALKDNGLVS